MQKHPMKVMVVDDDDVAQESVIRSLRKAGVCYELITANDGQEALNHLRGHTPGVQAEGSIIVLLDLNMPHMNGFEFLAELRDDPALRATVVFVLTTSDSDTDRTRAYHQCIAGYMVKSSVGPQFSHLVRLLETYHAAIHLPI
ncbi:response regulator [Zoogloea sp.]|uniref:response regulator n=1 Tax=Zoogloea sp. TaxID=49181 RepID=UPI0035B42BF1